MKLMRSPGVCVCRGDFLSHSAAQLEEAIYTTPTQLSPQNIANLNNLRRTAQRVQRCLTFHVKGQLTLFVVVGRGEKVQIK
jgi:hypothetical protein